MVIAGDFDVDQVTDLVQALSSRACRRPAKQVPRDIPKEPIRHQGTARHGRRAVAAAGGRRRVSHHLRRPSGFVSAAHRLEGAVRRAELADLSQAGVRDRAGAHRVRRRQHHRAPEPVLRRRDRQSGQVAGGCGEGAHRRDGSAQGRGRHRARAAAREEPVRARLHPRPRSRCRTRRRIWRTPRSSTRTSRPPTASSTSSRRCRSPTCKRVAQTYFTPERRVVLHVMPKGGTR